jgi:hypothetical protein
MADNLLVFNFDGDYQLTVTVFDEDMCRRQFVAPAPAPAKPAVSSSSSDEDDQ